MSSSSKETREGRDGRDGRDGIAVVGMSGRFPGARNLDEFWRNLRDGVESVRELSRETLAAAGVEPALLDNPRYVRAGVELEDVELFDAPFFGINPREAEVMDPQQRLFLECAWEALEDAGHDPGRFPGAIGVFASSLMSQYLLVNLLPNPEVLETVGGLAVRILNDKDFLATRVSYKLNLRGPSLSVQTACSSSLVAFHLACQSLMSYECDMALVGGVSVNLPRGSGYLYTEGGIYSPDGHCRAFDARAAGTLNGSGLGVMVLRRLEDAAAEGDRVRAVVLSTAVNNDGSLKVGFTAPSVEGQAEVVAAAQAFADVNPESITYIEAHGTGTALGDPVEVAALTRVFREQTSRKGFCALGSVKTNIGHLDAAAGVAGLIKTVLALEHRQLPPSLNCDEPNPAIGFPETPFYVNTRLSEWRTDGGPRRAGVSALGVGGTNAHVILEEAPEGRLVASASRPWQVLALSARDEGALEEMTDRLARHLRANPGINLADVAFTLEAGRAPFPLRRTLAAADPADAAEALEARDPKRVFTASAPEEGSAEPVFLFSGQGSQYPGMGAELYRDEPVFREAVDRCAELLRTHLGLDLREVLFPSAETAEAAARRLGQTFLTQPAIFVVSYATARLWMSWGVKPKAMIGHSIGEYVAACLSGVMSLEDALALVAARGRLLQSLPPGGMLSVPLPEAEVLPLLGSRLSLAAVNGPALCAVSGPEEAIEELAGELAARGVESRRLHTSHAFHSAMMNPILGAFAERVAKVELKAPRIPYLSNVTGAWITPEEVRDPRYWTRHLRETVRFSAGIEELLRRPDRVLLEVGPGQALTRIARLHRVDGRAPVALASLRHPQEEVPDLRFLLATLGRLWQAGVAIDWKAFRRGEKRRRVALPTYPFQRRGYWIAPPRGEASARRRSGTGRLWVPVWREASLSAASPGSPGEVWLLSGSGETAYGLARRLEQRGQEVVLVHAPEDFEAALRRLSAEGRSPAMAIHLDLGDETGAPDAADAITAFARGLESPESPQRAAVIVSRTEDVSGEDVLILERVLASVPFSGEGRRRIDVSPVRPGSAQEERLLDLLAADLLAVDPAPVAAYRGTRRWVPGFEPLSLPEGSGPQEGIYLLGGSPTEPSLELASLLAEAGCRVVEAALAEPEDLEALRGVIYELAEGRVDAEVAALRDLAELTEGRSLDLVAVVSDARSKDAAARFADALAHEQNRTGRTPWLRLGWQRGEPLRPEDRELLRRLWAPGFPSQVVVAVHDPEAPALEAPAARHERPELQSAYAAPRNELERRVAGIWRDLLGIERVGIHDDFFELGGNSLLATQALSRVRDVLRIEMPLRDLFEAPTVAELAGRLEASEEAKRQTLPTLARRPGSRPTELPLSAIQRRLWILDSLEPGNPAYNMLTALRVWGDLDPAALAGSFREIVRRHDALRARFELLGEQPVQRIEPRVRLDLPLVDLGALPAGRRDEEGRRLALEERRFPFDLSRGPLVRTVLVRLGAGEHLLLPTFHHIVFDGWSQGVLIAELAPLYAAAVSGNPSPLAELPLQYADYALWQQEWLEAGGREAELAYWREQLAGAPPFLELPTDRPRPLAQSFRGSSLSFAIPEIGGSAGDIAALGRVQGATLFMTLLAAFDVLLSRYTGMEDVVVGTPVANRERTEMEGLIGCFLNTLALRGDLSGRPTFLDLLARVRETTLEAFAHQNLPFEELVEELQPERSLGQNPVFQVALLLETARGLRAELPGLRFETLEQDSGTAKFDLTLALEERDGALAGVAEYKTDLFEAATIRRLAGHFGSILQASLDDPHRSVEDLTLLTAAERHQVAVEWSGAPRLSLEETVPARFLEQAARTPEAIAVRYGDSSLTYGELAGRVESLARYLRSLGVRPGDPVGLSVERSPDLVAGVLGILRSGGAYLPLDPGYPDARLELLLGDALEGRPGAVLLTESRLAERLSGLAPAGARVVCLDADRLAIESADAEVKGPGAGDLAYLIYTSGTTGRPKAVFVEHRQLAAVLRASEAFGFRAGDAMPCLASSSFDIFLFELLNPLLAGGTTVLVDLRPALDLERLVDLLETSSQVHAVPALMRQVVEAVRAKGRGPELYRGLRTIFVGGDAVPADLLADLREVFPSAEVRVLYGPTESTIICSSDVVQDFGDTGRVSIGRALSGASLRICDPAGHPVPIGVPGEIRIGGAGVTRGYLHRPDLTAERFVPDPFSTVPGARAYRSGDLARLLPDGRLEFLGRTDNQVKVRGFRIELGEVESALLAHPEVREAVALVRQDGGEKQLVAYVAPGVPADLRPWLQQRLPDPMVPSAFVAVDTLPLTSHGKVDRKTLERIALPTTRREGDFAAPRTQVEALLARIWSELLRVGPVGIHDNFFELGGDSILSIQVVSRAAREGCRITPRQMFEHQTIAALSAVASSLASVSVDQGPVHGPVELTPIQRWFFAGEPVEPHHFNQAVLLAVRAPLTPEIAARAFAALLVHHDALRLRFERTAEGWRQWNDASGVEASWSRLDLSGVTSAGLERAVTDVQASLDLTAGPLARGVWIDLPGGEARLLLAVHHLAVDGVSWRVLLEDLEMVCGQIARGETFSLPAKTTSFQAWSRQLAEHARSMELEPELSWWQGEIGGESAVLPVDFPEGANTEGSLRSVSSRLTAEETRALLHDVPSAYRTQINDVLLAALALALAAPGRPLRVALEGHGREEILPDADLSRTVGWFTALYPVRLETGAGPGDTLKRIKEHLRALPGRGLGFGLLSWLREEGEELRHASPQVSFNYLGQLDQVLREGSLFAISDEPAGPMRSPRALRRYDLDVVGGVTGGRLQVEWAYSANRHRPETVEVLSDRFLACLRELIAHCREIVSRGLVGYTPSDFPLAGLDGATLGRVLGRGVEDLYPLSPVQEGLLFHSLYAPGSGVYVDQLGVTLRSARGSVEPEAIERACRWLVEQHPVLRTSFLWRDLDRPLQAVHSRVEVEIAVHDWRGLETSEVERRTEELQREDRERGFDLSSAPLTRWTLVRLADDEYWLLWTHHHILIDGWSFAALAAEFLAACEAFAAGEEPAAPRRPLYRDYIAWIERQDLSETEAYWRRTLAGWEEPTPIPIRREPAGPETGTATAALALSLEETAELQALARRHQLTLNTLAQAAWALLLGRYSGGTDIVFGATVAGRPADLPGVDRMVGLFINTLPVRVATDGVAHLLPWLQALQLGQSELRQHEHSPLVKVQKWSVLPAGRELFDSILVFENYPREAAMQSSGGSAGVEIADVRSHEQTNYPLTILVVPGDTLMVRLEYNRSLFETAAAARMAGHLRNVLAALARQLREGGTGRLEDLSLLGATERRQLLEEWNDTSRPYAGPELLHEWIEAQAARMPSAEAVRFESESLSYAELSLRADGLARHLRAIGVGPDVLVGVCMERSLELVVSLLAVLKAGGAYVPLDPGYPAERLAFMLADSGTPVLLTQPRLAGLLPASAETVLVEPGATEWAGEPLRLGVDPDGLAYMIYTSGSTGRPKGAMNTHRAIVNRLLWMQEAYGLGANDRVLQKTPFSFDVSVWEFFWPLMTGACLVVARPEGHRDGAYLVDLIRRERVTTLHFVPSMLRAFLEQPGVEECSSIRRVVCSGEALPHELQERFFSRCSAELHNLYGPTEAAVDVSFWACRRDDERSLVPIGRPIANVRLPVLDSSGSPCPVGVPGELHIGGVALARGYWGRPELTADRFVPDPFSQGGRLYRTGDLARVLPDGSIDYLGRLDHQVKIRGFRIELGEIEAALLGYEGVRSAAVLARQDTPGSPRLVAYVVAADTPSVSDLRQWLGTTLPEHMVPSAFVFLDALPLSPSGKLDRRALPAPGSERSEGTAYVAPRTEPERVLAEIWESVLLREAIGIDDNFFELGGDSILSLRVVAQAQKRGLDLTLQQLFQLPTVRRLAAAIGRTEAAPARPVLEPFALVEPEDRAKLPDGLEDAYPLARLQAGMLFHSGYRTGATAYHQVLSYHLRAPFDAESFRAALARLVGRHAALRTSFDLGSFREPLQWVHASAEPRLAVEDLSALPPAEQAAAVASRVDAETWEPFDESRPPLLRVLVQLRGGDTFQVTMSFHHAILDGWSAASLLTELFQDYLAALRGEALALGAPAVRFRDLVALEREALASEDGRSFWAERLRDLSPSAVPLWPSAGETGMRRLDVPLSAAVTEGVREVARSAGAPLKSALLAAHLKVLGRLAGREDVVTGAVFNTRPEEDEGERALGLFLNTLPVRLRLEEGSWTDLVRGTFEEERALLPYRRVPLAELQKRMAGETLFEVMFNFVHFHVYGAVARMDGVEVLGSTFRAETTFLLSVEFGLGLDGTSLHLQIDHDASRLPVAEAEWIAGFYRRALESMAAGPAASHRLWTGLGEAECQQVRFEWNDTRRPYAGPELLHEWIEAQAARTPSAEAVRFEGESLSYAELSLRADGLARHLRALGVGPDVLVGVCMERSLELVVSLLAVLKAGGAYVPLDPGYPAERLAFMLEDSGTPVLLTQPRLAGLLPASAETVLVEPGAAEWSGEPLRLGVDPDGLAYMIYTSGSTGRPKGAMNTHRAIVNRLLWMQEAYGLDANDRVLQKTPFSFDVSVWEFFWPLMTGACLVVARPEGHRDGAYLVDLIRRERVTTLHFVPSMLRAFLEQPGVEECPSIRRVVCSGEALPHELQERFFSRSAAELHNLYGPTEAAVDVSFWECRRDDERSLVPIGRPIANVRLHVLDGSGSPCPVSVPGELHIGGVALARGYWGRPELTADRFVPDPFSEGGRLYRTGDLARVLPDGSIDYLGRLDHQVKIRGFRIELGEIEAALLGHEGVRSAAVLARQDTPGSPRLVAYVVAADTPPSVPELRQWLGTTLPEHMVPSAFVFLDALPLSPSGKLDRRALPAPGSERSEGTAYVAPRTEPERVLAEIWGTVLGRDGIGIEDNFFELGGDSILSLQIVARANQAGFRLTPEQMFRHPTVASLASAASLAPALEAEQGPVAGPVPLTPIQSWFFEAGRTEPHHWNQAVLLSLRRPVGAAVLERALAALLEHHDALRLRFAREARGWHQTGTLPGIVPGAPLTAVDLSALPGAKRSPALERVAGELQAGLDLENGPIVRAALFHLGSGEPDRLLLAIHHLAVDGVSWRILLEDLWTACEQLGRGEGVKLPPKTTSFQSWAEGLAERARSGAFDAELEHWLEAAGAPVAQLPVDISAPAEANTVASARSVAVSLRPDETEALLQEVPRAYQTQINDVLLAALARTFRSWTGEGYLRVDLEGHGREDVLDGADVSRTVGWFTALYPVLLHLSGSGDPGEDLKAVKEELRQIPGRGIGFGLLRYLGSDPDALADTPPAEVSFNYLGQLDRVLPEASPFGPAPESAGDLQSPRDRRPWLIEIVASLSEGRLGVTWLYSASVHRRDTLERLANTYLNELRALIEHCRSPHAGGFTPSDFPFADLGQEGLDEFLAALQEG